MTTISFKIAVLYGVNYHGGREPVCVSQGVAMPLQLTSILTFELF